MENDWRLVFDAVRAGGLSAVLVPSRPRLHRGRGTEERTPPQIPHERHDGLLPHARDLLRFMAKFSVLTLLLTGVGIKLVILWMYTTVGRCGL